MNENIESQINDLQKQIEAKRAEILALRAQLVPEEIHDYRLKNWEENEVLLSSLFGESNELLLIHNMGKRCSYCTLWADGFNSLTEHINNRMPFVVVSPDEPSVQKEFAESRNWRFKMLSAHGSSFTADLGFEPHPKTYWPGVSALIRKDGQIFRVTKDTFGPGDFYCSAWHFFDLFPERDGGWQPKYSYH